MMFDSYASGVWKPESRFPRLISSCHPHHDSMGLVNSTFWRSFSNCLKPRPVLSRLDGDVEPPKPFRGPGLDKPGGVQRRLRSGRQKVDSGLVLKLCHQPRLCCVYGWEMGDSQFILLVFFTRILCRTTLEHQVHNTQATSLVKVAGVIK
jgi:hypothetical protein